MTPEAPRQPIFNIPGALLTVLAVLVAIHVVRLCLGDAQDAELLARAAFVPARLAFIWNPDGVVGRLAAFGDGDADIVRAEVARFFLGDGSPQPWTLLTYSLLHGNWAHLGLNSVWLLAFGAPVARRLRSGRFLLFLACGALAGALVHGLLFPYSFQPLIGFSAAVSACMGAALRFMFQPRRGPGAMSDIADVPLLSIAATLRDRRVILFILVWLGTNFITGIGAGTFGMSDAPIAWQAHIGGFALGLLGLRWFDPSVRAHVTAPAEQPLATDEPDLS